MPVYCVKIMSTIESSAAIGKQNGGLEAPFHLDLQPTAQFNLRLLADQTAWTHASIQNAPEVVLYSGKFPPPLFKGFRYVVASRPSGIILQAALETTDEFRDRFGRTIGDKETLAPFINKYPQVAWTDDKTTMHIFNGDQMDGLIGLAANGTIIIQRGGPAGQIPITPRPHDLANEIEPFHLMIQRLISAYWKAHPETRNRHMRLDLAIDQRPQGAAQTFYSTYENVASRFLAQARDVTTDDIGGYAEPKAFIGSLMLDLADPKASRIVGSIPNVNKAVGITGADGVGKSLIVLAIARRMAELFKDGFKHYHLPLRDIVAEYGIFADDALKGVLDYVVALKKQGSAALVHLDNLDELVPPTNRNPFQQEGQPTMVVTDNEFNKWHQVASLITTALTTFDREMARDTGNIVVIGESRLPRNLLPQNIATLFRRYFNLRPTPADLGEMLVAQMNKTKANTRDEGIDPFDENAWQKATTLTTDLDGLTPRDIQNSILAILDRKKDAYDGTLKPITAAEIRDELVQTRRNKSPNTLLRTPIGFRLPV